MNLTEYLQKTEFSKQPELRRTLLFAFFQLRKNNITCFSADDIAIWMNKLGYSHPNKSRLKLNLKKSKLFVSGSTPDRFRIHPAAVEALDSEYPQLSQLSEEIISQNSVLPESLLQKNRTFILSLIKQINASFENNIFDGCAVLMRRLLEILLILSYQELKVEVAIQDGIGNFKQLNSIIDDAIVNKTLGLSRNTKECLDTFRKLGNFSAHKIYYNANRKSIESIVLDYRAAIEELMYKSALRS